MGKEETTLLVPASYVPSHLDAGDAVTRSVADPWQHQKQMPLVFGSSDSQSLSLQLLISPRRRRQSCAEAFLPASGEELCALC